MGSTQSRRSSPEQIGISKPQTNKSALNLLPRPPNGTDSSLAVAEPLEFQASTFDEDVVTSTSGDRRTRKDARQRLKTHLFSPATNSGPGSDSQGDSIAAIMAGLRGRLSRSGSSISHQSSTPGSTTIASCLGDSRQTNNAGLSSDDVTFPVQVSGKTEGSNSMGRALSSGNPVTPSTRPRAERPRILAIRRRSMFTPGVATRKKMDGFLSEQPQLRPSYHLDHRTNPEVLPPSMLAALDLAEDGHGSRGLARASTPCDYSHLGCLKQGTLHITNGAASPAPSANAFAPNLQESVAAEGYFPMVPPTGTHKGPILEREGAGLDMAMEKKNWAKDGTNEHEAEHRDQKNDQPDLGIDTQIKAFHLDVDTLVDSDRARNHATNSRLDFTIRNMGQQSTAETYASATLPDRASFIAEGYIHELPASPFVAAQGDTVDGGLGFISEKTNPDGFSFHDEGFVCSPSELSDQLYQSKEAMVADQSSSREDAFRTLNGASNNWPLKHHSQLASSAGSRTSSSGPESRIADSQVELEEHPSNADSGYSSTLSLWSLHNEQSLEAADGDPRPTPRPASSLYTYDKRLNLGQPKLPPKSPPPVPPKLDVAWSAAESGGSPTVSPKPITQQSHPGLPSSVIVNTPLDPHLPRLPSIPTGDDLRTSVIEASQDAVPNLPRKLQKSPRILAKRRSLTIQGRQEFNEQPVPPVPSEIVHRHTERLKSRPASGLAREVHPQPLEHDAAPDALLARVIFPVAKQEQSSNVHDRKPVREHRRMSLGLFSRSLRRSGSESRLGSQVIFEEPEVVPDLDKVISSLGGGPYDAAMSVSNPPKLRSWQDGMYPHQIGRMYKARSMFGMDNEAAALFARERSKDRGMSRQQHPNRAYSVCSGDFEGPIGRPVKFIRPQSIMENAPPVPAVPPTHLLESKAGERASTFPELSADKTSFKLPSVAENRNVASSGQQHRNSSSEKFPIRPIDTRTPNAHEGHKGKNTRPSGRYSSPLLRTHGLDLSDVPISVNA